MKIIKNKPIEYEDRITFPSVETIAEHFNISVEEAQDLHDNHRDDYVNMIEQFRQDGTKKMVQQQLKFEEESKRKNQAMKEAANELSKHVYFKYGKFKSLSQGIKSRKPIEDDFEITM